MSEPKPLTKMQWMKQELSLEDYFPSELSITRVLAGDFPECFEPELIDFILELEEEWEAESAE